MRNAGQLKAFNRWDDSLTGDLSRRPFLRGPWGGSVYRNHGGKAYEGDENNPIDRDPARVDQVRSACHPTCGTGRSDHTFVVACRACNDPARCTIEEAIRG